MSRAGRSKFLARDRHRYQLAKLLKREVHALEVFRHTGVVIFDVHAARELGERLVAFERHEGAEQVVADWRESQGLRAGLPPGFPHDALRWRQHVRLGRRLLEAIKGQPSACESCGGRRTSGLALELERYCDDLFTSHVPMTIELQGRIEREGQALVTERGLEGSPSVTLSFDTRAIDISGIQHLLACQGCRGTGHNLRGVLAEVDQVAGGVSAYERFIESR